MWTQVQIPSHCEGKKSEGDKIHTWGKEKGNTSVSCSRSDPESSSAWNPRQHRNLWLSDILVVLIRLKVYIRTTVWNYFVKEKNPTPTCLPSPQDNPSKKPILKGISITREVRLETSFQKTETCWMPVEFGWLIPFHTFWNLPIYYFFREKFISQKETRPPKKGLLWQSLIEYTLCYREGQER